MPKSTACHSQQKTKTVINSPLIMRNYRKYLHNESYLKVPHLVSFRSASVLNHTN